VGTKTSVAESRMAFASYAKGKVLHRKMRVLPAPSFLKVVSFVFGIVVELRLNAIKHQKQQKYILNIRFRSH
jgi:hypothetical protein